MNLLKRIAFAVFVSCCAFNLPQAEAKLMSQSSPRGLRQVAVTPFVLGQSFQKRDIKGVRFGVFPHQDTQEVIYILGGFHGDEAPSAPMVYRVMDYLKKHPTLYRHKTIYCVPEVNPDGVFLKTRLNANRVDLNRNFPTQNFIPNYKPGSRYFSGNRALSEPESHALHAFLGHVIKKHKSKVKILSVHAPLAMNNFNGPALALARAMETKNHYPAKGDIGYPTPGSFGTYYGNELGIPVITLETKSLNPEQAWQHNKEAILAFLKKDL